MPVPAEPLPHALGRGGKPTHYAFLWNNTTQNLGGVQTLMARMANRLAARGAVVDAVFLGEEVPQSVRVLFDASVRLSRIPPDERDAWLFPLHARREARPWMSADVAVPFNQPALFYTWSTVRTGGPLVLPYVVGPNAYYPPRSKWPFREHPAKARFRNEIPTSLICFMTDALRQDHTAATGADMREAHVLPLPVDTERFAAVERKPKRFEFVSVGRIDPVLKPYNTSFVAAVRQLHEEGFPIVWRIFGSDATGPYSHSFARFLAEQGVTGFIDYRGEIEYARFPEVLTDAYGFIGMGTAAIEAAAAGVPTVVAIALESRPVIQGLMHELPAGSCGERVASLGEEPAVDAMRRLMQLTPDAYDALCRREAAHALHTFGVEARIDEFEGMVTQLTQRMANPLRGRLRAWADTALDIARFAAWSAANHASSLLRRLFRLRA